VNAAINNAGNNNAGNNNAAINYAANKTGTHPQALFVEN
jgi:hypothetical protein